MHMLSLTRCPHALRLLSAAALLAGLLGNLGAAQPVQAASLTVTTTADELNTDGDCALREAIRAAELDSAVDACARGSGADTITVPAGTYRLNTTVTGSLTITGAGAATTTIDGGRLGRVFDVTAGANLTLANLTIRNGQPAEGDGGAIQNHGTVTILSSTISESATAPGRGRGGWGGGILNRGILALTDSIVMNNLARIDEDTFFEYAPGKGGGIANLGGQVTLTRSVVQGNTAENGNNDSAEGGGIYSNDGSVTLNESVIRGNDAPSGGGVFIGGGTALVTNSTVAENDGSGIANEVVGTTAVRSSTIVGNQAAGVENSSYYGGSLTISSTLIAQNDPQWGSDCYGAITSQGYNMIRSPRHCAISGDTITNLLNVDPLLRPLGDNGGPTLTYMLRPESPAIDAGSPATPGSGASACPTTDQRGVARPQDGNGDGTARCDIGALERPDTVVRNGGFELDSNADGTPDAWSANPRATRSNVVAQSGTYALRHQATDNSSYTVFSDPVVSVAAGQRYTFSGWVHIPATADAFGLEFQVRWRDAGSTILSTVPVQTFSAATSGWTSFTATLIAPPNAAQATIRQVVTSLNATLYVDDVQVQPIETQVRNGGFELDSNADGTPDAWSADPRATRSNVVAQSGIYALRHQATDNSSYTVFSDPVVPIVAGQRYTFSGSINIPATSDAFSLEFQVRWRDAAGNVLSTVPVLSRSWDTNGHWTSFAAPVVAPANATQATIRQVVTSLNTTLYVDNLAFGQ